MNNHSMKYDKEQDIKAFSARLRQALDRIAIAPDFKGRQREAGALAGKGSGAAKKWLNAEGYPSMESMIMIAKACDVSLEWLATGRGEMCPHVLNTKLLETLIRAVESAELEERTKIDTADKARLITRIYKKCHNDGLAPEPAAIATLVGLLSG